jgi:exopolysaccharide biosynthesis protein
MKTFNQFQAECWKTHKKVGMKMKGGKLVNDCRPKNEEVQNEGAAWTKKAGKNSVKTQEAILRHLQKKLGTLVERAFVRE